MFMNVLSKIVFCLYLFFIVITEGFSQKLSIETSIDTNRIVLGDQINLTYIVKAYENVVFNLPAFDKDLTEGIEIIGLPVIDSVKMDDGRWKVALELLITSFDTGIYYIPPQKFVVKDNLFTDTLLSSASYLEVFGVAIDTTYTVRDIKPIARKPITIAEVLLLLLVLILIVVLSYFIYVFIQKRKRKESFLVPAKPEEPPHITAFRELDKLKAQKLWQQKQVKEYYTRITRIIRWYIFKRFEIHALEETSDEILYYIKTLKLDDVNLQNLESLLNLADLVKFAKGEPNPEENILHLENAYEFINKTKLEESGKSAKSEEDNKEE